MLLYNYPREYCYIIILGKIVMHRNETHAWGIDAHGGN